MSSAAVASSSQKPDAVPSAVSWRRRLVWRGPVLWSLGVSAMILASSSYYYAAANSSTTSAPSTVAISPTGLVALVWMIGFVSWTIFCAGLWGSDVWRCLVQPAWVAPAVAAAARWSLDDVLQFLCDPGRWAARLAGAVLLPATLYALPTTPRQRAQVLRAAGVLPPPPSNSDDDDDDAAAARLLTEPGSWRFLLPVPLQKCLQPAVTAAATTCAEEDMGGYAESTDDEGDDASSQQQDQQPYSISPVWKTDNNSGKSSDNDDQASTGTAERTAKSTTQRSAPATTSQTQQLPEPHELIQEIVTDWLQAQLREKCAAGLAAPPQLAAAVAATAAAVLVLQWRHSATARALIRHGVHASVTAGAGTALAAALVAAAAAPHCLGTATATTTPTEPNLLPRGRVPSTAALDTGKFWLSSIIMTAWAAGASIPRPPRSTLRSWRTRLQAVPWKGAAAVFVLALFHQRRRRRLEREQQRR